MSSGATEQSYRALVLAAALALGALTGWSFSEPRGESWMEMPAGAVIDATEP